MIRQTFAPGRMGRVLAIASLTATAFCGTANMVQAATVPQNFTDTTFVGGLSNATAMQFAPDGRLFVCQQGGQLRVVKNGTLLATPFLSVTVNSSGERGLLGLAFDPDFATNGYIYVYYTATTPTIHNRVSRFRADPANPDVALTGSETVILDLDSLSSATNHNGGALNFGADGKLYIAVGENANPLNSQSLENLHGKMLRINADGSIPTSNPFYLSATGNNRAIWTLGLRNPFTFSVHRTSGRIFINDVGQNTWEEINEGLSGANYGWPRYEGVSRDATFVDPVFTYRHDTGEVTGCAITGGAWYDAATPTFPSEYINKYFFADYCGGWIRLLNPNSGLSSSFAAGISAPVDLKVGPDGALYYLARGTGSVGKITYAPVAAAPAITTHPQNQTVAEGQTATFSVVATGTAPLSYQWQRNQFDITGANSSTYSFTATAADNGAKYRCVVSNSIGSTPSNEATLTVTANTPPVPKISKLNTTYVAGRTINFSGSATDKQDGALPASAFTWSVVFYHDTHTHPFIDSIPGVKSGSFTIPNEGETATNVWYRLILTVRDSGGATASTYVDLKPKIVRLRISTSPGGGQFSLDGVPGSGLLSVNTVAGIKRTVSVPSPQAISGKSYVFKKWSDGGAQTHTVAPTKDINLTATFTLAP